MRHPRRCSGRILIGPLLLALLASVPLAVAQPNAGFRRLEGTCLSGAPAASPIRWIEGGGSDGACRAACETLSACGGYSFIRSGCGAPEARCLLFRRGGSLTFHADPCCTSGVRD